MTRTELNEFKLNEKSDVLVERRDLDQDCRECFAARRIDRFPDDAFKQSHYLALLPLISNPLTVTVFPFHPNNA